MRPLAAAPGDKQTRIFLCICVAPPRAGPLPGQGHTGGSAEALPLGPLLPSVGGRSTSAGPRGQHTAAVCAPEQCQRLREAPHGGGGGRPPPPSAPPPDHGPASAGPEQQNKAPQVSEPRSRCDPRRGTMLGAFWKRPPSPTALVLAGLQAECRSGRDAESLSPSGVTARLPPCAECVLPDGAGACPSIVHSPGLLCAKPGAGDGGDGGQRGGAGPWRVPTRLDTGACAQGWLARGLLDRVAARRMPWGSSRPRGLGWGHPRDSLPSEQLPSLLAFGGESKAAAPRPPAGRPDTARSSFLAGAPEHGSPRNSAGRPPE